MFYLCSYKSSAIIHGTTVAGCSCIMMNWGEPNLDATLAVQEFVQMLDFLFVQWKSNIMHSSSISTTTIV